MYQINNNIQNNKKKEKRIADKSVFVLVFYLSSCYD